mgnify:CR=1 FL=1
MPMQEESLLVPKTKCGQAGEGHQVYRDGDNAAAPGDGVHKAGQKDAAADQKDTHRGKPSSVVSVKRVRTEADIYAPPGVNSTKSLSVYQLHRPLARAEAPQFC